MGVQCGGAGRANCHGAGPVLALGDPGPPLSSPQSQRFPGTSPTSAVTKIICASPKELR